MSALETFRLSRTQAEEFFEVYQVSLSALGAWGRDCEAGGWVREKLSRGAGSQCLGSVDFWA